MPPHHLQSIAINSGRNEPPTHLHQVKTPAAHRSKNKTKVGNKNIAGIKHNLHTQASMAISQTRQNVFTSQSHRINTSPEHHLLPGNPEISLLSTD